MTKLEEKLLELGYVKTCGLYWKKFYGKASIILKICASTIEEQFIPKEDYLSSLDIEEADRIMKKDLEELREYESF